MLNLDERMASYVTLIKNAQNVEKIGTEIAFYGYPSEKMQELETLYSEVESLDHIKSKEYGDQFQATQIFETKFVEAKKMYMRHVKIARIVFEDQVAAYTTLELIGDRKDSYNGWFAQARTFYNNLLKQPKFISKMASLNCKKQEIMGAINVVADVEKAKLQQDVERGEAQEATVLRDNKIDVLDREMSRLTKVYQIAFEENPHVLEEVGILVKTD